eukprot:354984-Chlamydomonas_euryale.AAC.1
MSRTKHSNSHNNSDVLRLKTTGLGMDDRLHINLSHVSQCIGSQSIVHYQFLDASVTFGFKDFIEACMEMLSGINRCIIPHVLQQGLSMEMRQCIDFCWPATLSQGSGNDRKGHNSGGHFSCLHMMSHLKWRFMLVASDVGARWGWYGVTQNRAQWCTFCDSAHPAA